MAIRSVEYVGKSRLACAGCSPADVILCIKDGIVLQNVTAVVPRNYVFATLVSFVRISNSCGGHLFRYVFEYDDVQLILNATIRCSDIEGVVCQGCLTDFIQQSVANTPFILDADSGPNKNVYPGSTLAITGDGVLETVNDVNPLFELMHIVINPGNPNDVLTTVGTTVVWAPPTGGGGTGFWNLDSDTGPDIPVNLGDTLIATGDGVVFTNNTTLPNVLHIGIAPGANNFVLTTILGVVQWAPTSGGGGAGFFIIAGESGPSQAINLGDTATFIGDGVLNTVAAIGQELHIVIAPGAEGEVLTTVLGVPTWAAPTGGGNSSYVAPPLTSGAAGALGQWSNDANYSYEYNTTFGWGRIPIQYGY